MLLCGPRGAGKTTLVGSLQTSRLAAVLSGAPAARTSAPAHVTQGVLLGGSEVSFWDLESTPLLISDGPFLFPPCKSSSLLVFHFPPSPLLPFFLIALHFEIDLLQAGRSTLSSTSGFSLTRLQYTLLPSA